MAKETSKDEGKKDSMRKTIKDIIEIVLFLGIAVLLVFSFNWILAAALKTDIPLVVVTSESMEPTYYGSNRPGHGGVNDIRKDMLIVRGVEPSEIEVGDVIVFYRVLVINTSMLDYDREPIVHRVNHIYYNVTDEVYWFTTKGDNPGSNDDFVTSIDIGELTIHQDRVIGKIIGRIKYLGGIVSYFRTTAGRTILIVGVAVIFLLTFVFGSFGKSDEDKDTDVFDQKPDKLDQEGESKGKAFLNKLKKFFNKMMKHKHIVFPSLILGIIVFIPIIDTFAAGWGSHFGIVDTTFDGADFFQLKEGNTTFVFFDVEMNCPGHWHQKFRSFDIVVSNATTGEVYGVGNWTIKYNFEGLREVSSGVWIDTLNTFSGANYTVTVTANLQSKFGRVWTDIFAANFTLLMRP
ncbi:MAG: signal peptidase I [Asgard group archaeon]|nr:signal peptidase I [Asgard group archaeon]